MSGDKPRTMRVLVVDDEPQIAEVLRLHLPEPGFSLKACAYGEEGLEEAGKNDYDLIVLDIMMPGIHGIHALRKLRVERRTAMTPVIVYSSMSAEEAAEKVSKHDAVFLNKSGAIKDLAELVKRTLARP